MKVITEEIRYWKKHQLLPDVYCDYLLALYTKGENELNAESHKGRKGIANNVAATIQLIFLVFIIPFSFLVMYVLSYLFVIKISILLLFGGYAVWTLLYYKRRNMIYIHISFMVICILILLGSVYVSNHLDLEQWETIAVILANVLVWLVIGLNKRITYLIVTSIFGIFVTIIYYFATSTLLSL